MSWQTLVASDNTLPPIATGILGLVLVAVVAYVHRSYWWRFRSCGVPLPPGPKGFPFVGNMFDMPREKLWEGFKQLCTRYGALYISIKRVSRLAMHRRCGVLEHTGSTYGRFGKHRRDPRDAGKAGRGHLRTSCDAECVSVRV